MTLVRIVKNWREPDLLRQTPQGNGVWGQVRFTLDPVTRCDFLVFLNNAMPVAVSAHCPPAHIWAVMQEPYMPGHSDWLVERHEFFAKVFTHHPPCADPKYVTSHPALPWYVNQSYDQLLAMPGPTKTRDLSWVVGNADDLPGHARRYRFLQAIRQDQGLAIDLFGRAVRPIADKWDGLAPYRYSLAIENSSSPDYWTEKVADCFLARTVPIYFGCTNLADYFPAGSFIQLDISDPAAGIARIKEILKHDDLNGRQAALEEARDRVLHRYQLFPFIAGMIEGLGQPAAEARTVRIPPYRRSLKARLRRLVYKARKKLHLL